MVLGKNSLWQKKKKKKKISSTKIWSLTRFKENGLEKVPRLYGREMNKGLDAKGLITIFVYAVVSTIGLSSLHSSGCVALITL